MAKAAKPRRSKPSKAVTVTTPAEAAVQASLAAKVRERPPLPLLKAETVNGVCQVSHDHPSPQIGGDIISDALASVQKPFIDGLIGQVINATGRHDNMASANFMMAAIRGIGPQDETECMIAAQMAATHMLAMAMAGRVANPSNTATFEQVDSHASRLTKLTRTFTMQLDALKRYRTGGEQKVTVQHVNVNEGGQAIVGNVVPIARPGRG